MNSPAPTSLPTETLLLIFRNFCLHCRATHQPTAPDAHFNGTQHFHGTQQDPDSKSWYSLERQTLFSLCLVSRRLRDIAQPILYHEFVLGYGDSWRSALYTWDKRLQTFMRTMAQRRDLAALVKRVYIHPRLLGAISDEEAEVAPEESARGLAVSLPEYRDAFRAASRSQLLRAELMGLLLAQLPNLDRLSLQTRVPFGGVSSSALRAAGVASLSLNTFDICAHSVGHVYWDGQAMFQLAYEVGGGILEIATGLTTLNLHMCCGVGDIHFRLHRGTLRITNSSLSKEDLRRLLVSCDSLDTFVYEATLCDISNHDHFVPTDAIGYLNRHRKTLKSLYLDLRNRHYSLIVYPTYLPISSLKDFVALENLLLNSAAICNTIKETTLDYSLLARLLPPNIVSLRVVGSFGKLFSRLSKGLIGLAEAILSGTFPRLRIVKCEADHLHDFPGAELFASVGVDYGFENWPYSCPTQVEEGYCIPPPNLSEMPPMPLPTGDSDSDI